MGQSLYVFSEIYESEMRNAQVDGSLCYSGVSFSFCAGGQWGFSVGIFSAECTIGMVWGLTPLWHSGTKTLRCKL